MSTTYALGQSVSELRCLSTLARITDPITERTFRAAGLTSGMRVLDVGSGAGDVAILLADIVGPADNIVGTDKSAEAIYIARRRVAS